MVLLEDSVIMYMIFAVWIQILRLTTLIQLAFKDKTKKKENLEKDDLEITGDMRNIAW